MKLVFATHNAHKLQEVKECLPKNIQVLGLSDLDCHEDIPENGTSLIYNAIAKSQYVRDKFSMDCFSDDTGLEVRALDNAPGVYSARYAGNTSDSEANIRKLLMEMSSASDRYARFRTVIALFMGGNLHTFEGVVEGHILRKPLGNKGFGYDSVFLPLGHQASFAQMSLKQKNDISHRSKAIDKLVHFLKA